MIGKPVSKSTQCVLCVVIIILGLITFIKAESFNLENQNFISKATPVDAYVTNISTHVRLDKKYSNDIDIRVKYIYDAHLYENVYVGYTSEDDIYKPGKLIQVYVDPQNPSSAKIEHTEDIFLGLILIAIGLIMFIYCYFYK